MRSLLCVMACQVALLAAAGPVAADPAIVVLVRHAEKATTPGDDPDLSPAGEARARTLAAVLADTGIAAIVTTQFVRTQHTAAVVAADRQLQPTVVRTVSDTAAHAQAVASAVRARPAGEAVLVVGHSNTVPAIIAALGGPTLPALCDGEYSNLFVLVMSPGRPRLIRALYGDATGCQ